MTVDPREYLKTDARTLELRAALQEGVGKLVGVTPEIVNILKKLNIASIFDLATSRAFADATSIADARRNQQSFLRRAGNYPPGLVIPEGAIVPVEELSAKPVAMLASVPPAVAAECEAVLGVRTIEEMASFPPFSHAKAILDDVFFPERSALFDPEYPEDLVPRNGVYPTERVSVTTLLLDELPVSDVDHDVLGNSFAPIDLAKATQTDFGFQRVAFGTMLTFTQSWYQEGVTLGQLLHSAALAPGESTRIAVIDWSRRSRAGQTEVQTQTEDLANDTSANRSISEVTRAVAREAQGGFSNSRQSSWTVQQATATGGDQNARSAGLVEGLVGGAVDAVGDALGDAVGAIGDVFGL